MSAYRIGGSLGLAILVTVAAAAQTDAHGGPTLLAHRVASSFTAGTAMFAVALAAVLIGGGRTTQRPTALNRT